MCACISKSINNKEQALIVEDDAAVSEMPEQKQLQKQKAYKIELEKFNKEQAGKGEAKEEDE